MLKSVFNWNKPKCTDAEASTAQCADALVRPMEQAIDEAAAKLKAEFPDAAVIVGAINSRYWFAASEGMLALALAARILFHIQLQCFNASGREAVAKVNA